MDEDILSKLKDLVCYISSADAPWPHKAASSGTNNSALALCGGVGAKDLLDYLSFNLKYLVFDLEATRRENAILRSIIAREGE